MGTQSITNQNISAVQILQVERVSVASDGTEANDRSIQSLNLGGWPLRSLLQRCLELVPGDTNDSSRTSSCSTDRPAPPRASRWPATALKRTEVVAVPRFRRMAVS